ncbi:MAG: hypothetical protein PHY08_10585 [Candidatus Cloacimonetes bacterium]|nr:hypothetical protein [Candidatus Cloacimonadota bacterium]
MINSTKLALDLPANLFSESLYGIDVEIKKVEVDMTTDIFIIILNFAFGILYIQ